MGEIAEPQRAQVSAGELTTSGLSLVRPVDVRYIKYAFPGTLAHQPEASLCNIPNFSTACGNPYGGRISSTRPGDLNISCRRTPAMHLGCTTFVST